MQIVSRHSIRLIGSGLLGVLLMAAVQVKAQTQQIDSTASNEPWPQASLEARAMRTVPQDSVRITLALEVSADTQTQVAKQLEVAVRGTLDQAKEAEGVKVYSGDYRLWPMSDTNGHISNWRGRAAVILESSSFARASEVSGALSTRMPVAAISFYLSPEARMREEAALLEQASKAFSAKAKAVAHSFGYADYTLRQVNVGGSSPMFESAPRMALAMAADVAAPLPMEPGTEQVSVTVSGSIVLHSSRQ